MMKFKYLLLCSLFFVLTLFSLPTSSLATNTSNRYIALHDRLLAFEKEEVRLENAQIMVPFEKMARYLYADIQKSDEQITITKNATSISYNFISSETTINQEIIPGNTMKIIDDILYIPIRLLGESTGFKVDYLSDILTVRLYTNHYPHMSHPQFIQELKKQRKEIPLPKPTTPADPSKPIVYLTFDDGPNRYTSEHLNIMKKFNVKGTFFFVGNQIASYKSLTQLTYKEGHTLALHSMTHDRNKVYASAQAFVNEMKKETEMIQSLTGFKPTLVRTPYGSKPYVTSAMRGLLKQEGYKLWDWDVDTLDWQVNEANFQQIIARVKTGVEKARRAKDQHIVILLHDRVQTTKALPGIISWLQQQGYSIQPYKAEMHVPQNFWHDPEL
ncbi:polysaccharide deacetylase family protein [Paenisporosarcina sp.]|uniref:polysaccharide deacetylase n=1 Tax=Paenisporosarcina sp. TaxID=1932001 RepID=UPI003C70CB18